MIKTMLRDSTGGKTLPAEAIDGSAASGFRGTAAFLFEDLVKQLLLRNGAFASRLECRLVGLNCRSTRQAHDQKRTEASVEVRPSVASGVAKT